MSAVQETIMRVLLGESKDPRLAAAIVAVLSLREETKLLREGDSPSFLQFCADMSDYQLVARTIAAAAIADPPHARQWLELIPSFYERGGPTCTPAFRLGTVIGLFEAAVLLDEYDAANNFEREFPTVLSSILRTGFAATPDEMFEGRLSNAVKAYVRSKSKKHWRLYDIHRLIISLHDGLSAGEERHPTEVVDITVNQILYAVFGELNAWEKLDLFRARSESIVMLMHQGVTS